MRFHLPKIGALLAGLALLVPSSGKVHEQAPAAVAFDQAKASRKTRLAKLSDGVILPAMETDKIPGLVVSIVRDDQIALIRGYGFADIAKRQRIDPERDLFRAGSITKTFTFTAVMQLVEQGKLDLDADVNTYLTAFKIPEAFGKPVTLRDLMTHRAGFEEAFRDMWEKDPGKLMSLGDWLAQTMPDRVFAPGTITSYSNYGAALAGYIVQEVSGEPYEWYIAQHIFKPLGMHSSSVGQPVAASTPRAMPLDLRSRLVTSYRMETGKRKESGFEFIAPAPAGAISTSAPDMARYMLGWLGDGALDGQRFLHAKTARTMHRRPYPGRPGADFAHGFRTGKINGLTTFEHSGATFTSYSTLLMLPDAGLGIFIATNGGKNPSSPHEMARKILTRLIAPAPEPLAGLDMSRNALAAYTGRFLTTRRVYTGLAKLHSAFAGLSEVTAIGDNRLAIHAGGEKHILRPLDKDLFEDIADREQVYFLRNPAEKVSGYVTEMGDKTNLRMNLRDDVRGLLIGLGLASFLALSVLAMQLVRTLRSKRESGKARLRWIAFGSALATLVLAALFTILVIQMLTLGLDVIYVWPMTSALLLGPCAMLVGIGTVAMLASLWPIWKNRRYSRKEAALFTLFTVALCYLVFELEAWNMLGWSLA